MAGIRVRATINQPVTVRWAPNQPDIIDEIDALTDDAASWSANGGEHTRPIWTAPAGCMTAIAADMTGARPVTIYEADPGTEITRLVGDPAFNRIQHLYQVAFWVGDNSVRRQPVNTGATTWLPQLLEAVQQDQRAVAGAGRGAG